MQESLTSGVLIITWGINFMLHSDFDILVWIGFFTAHALINGHNSLRLEVVQFCSSDGF